MIPCKQCMESRNGIVLFGSIPEDVRLYTFLTNKLASCCKSVTAGLEVYAWGDGPR